MSRPGPLPVVVNAHGGTARKLGDALEPRLRAAFAELETPIALELADGKDVAARVAAAGPAERVVVGGGDGTLAAAAAKLAGTSTALGIVPLGTRNHFARQLAVPLELEEAARLAATGRPTAVDVARIVLRQAQDERVVLNNASVGIYARLVRQRKRLPGPKWLATIPAAWRVLRAPRPQALALRIDGEHRTVVTPLLLVGNNRYALAAARLGERDSLTGGVLSLYAVPPLGLLALLWFALRTLFGRASPHFELLGEARELTIEGHGEIDIALDGEPLKLPLPLTIVIDPRALQVIAPPEPKP